MSWGTITASDTADNIEASLNAAADAYKANAAGSDVEFDAAASEQIAGAIKAAVAVVPVVAPDQEVSVTLNGHANPDHKPYSGWGNDTVYITVTNVSKAAPTA